MLSVSVSCLRFPRYHPPIIPHLSSLLRNLDCLDTWRWTASHCQISIYCQAQGPTPGPSSGQGQEMARSGQF